MIKHFIVEQASGEEVRQILKKAAEYSEANIPLLKEQAIERICKVIKTADGDIMTGLIGSINHSFKSVYIDVLWVKAEYRKSGYGTTLLKHIEKEAFAKGIVFAYLGTIGFQAKDFYLKNGYEVFSILDECALNHKMYWMKKKLTDRTGSLEPGHVVENGTGEDVYYIDDRIVEFNAKQVAFTNQPAFQPINRVVKDSEGDVIAGIAACILPYTDLTIDAIWAREDGMGEELKAELLNQLEEVLKERGGHVAIHETFDEKVKELYVRNGYEVYGTLDDYPAGHKCYFLKKVF